MTKLIFQRCALAVLVFCCLSAQAVVGKNAYGWTEAKLALAAPYCIDTMGFKYGDAYFNTSPRAKYWVSQMGPGFWSMHHYCGAMLNLQSASTLPASQRDFRYKQVLDDLVYVVNTTKPDFVMLPEIYSRIGEVELLRNNPAAAREAFERARSQRPDYVPAYTHWAQALVKLGKPAEARALVREGLSHAPQAQALRDLYRRLGGDLTKLPPPPAADAKDSTGASAPGPASAASAASSP